MEYDFLGVFVQTSPNNYKGHEDWEIRGTDANYKDYDHYLSSVVGLPDDGNLTFQLLFSAVDHIGSYSGVWISKIEVWGTPL